LIQRGADLNVIDKSENNSLTLALRNGHKKIANSLLDRGIRVDPQKIHRNGETTMMLAARCGTAKVAVALIQKGADVNARDANGRTALMHASHCGALKVVKKLVEFEADVNIKDNEGKSAIDFSFGKRNDKITVHLLEYGAGENLDTYFVPPSKVRQQREKIYRRIRRIESVLFPDDTPVIAQLIAEFTFGVRYLTNYIEKHSYKD
jgi:ankyrin repeat protein